MSSPITISNKALSKAVTRSQISAFDDGSVEGTTCGIWYDDVRQRLLRTAPWAFARRQTALTQVANFTESPPSPYPWGFSYAYPSDCIKFRYVLPPPVPPPSGASPPIVGIPIPWPMFGPSRTNRYLVMNTVDANGNVTKLLVSNVCQATGVYTADITDTSQFDPLFESALVYALAAEIIAPLSGNVGLVGNLQQLAENMILQARVADSNESITTSDVVVDWIAVRGQGGGWNNLGGPLGNLPIGSQWGQWNGDYDNMGWSS